ncbi:hypothetical protein CYMTET_54180 [Cymbomonas tetramitiformis]|uniref:Uncharacterized protein n=1 Tax=Cymbomonas tetramitiformis TaxID=36881 RepID=A0AAE0EPL5_9CHLO|nr:hypothetical protein CYMTET_54180 [Cymbomonas tetramitiformis]
MEQAQQEFVLSPETSLATPRNSIFRGAAAEELSALRAGHNIFCLKGEARQADSVVKERRLECSVEVPGTGMERRCTIRYLTE